MAGVIKKPRPKLIATIGDGLMVNVIDDEEFVEIDSKFHDGPRTLTVQTDSHISLENRNFTLTKEFTTYQVRRCRGRVVIDIYPISTHTTTETVELPLGYQGGYGTPELVALRTSQPKAPNFYKSKKMEKTEEFPND